MTSVSDDTGPSTNMESTTSLVLGTFSSLPTSRSTTPSGTSGAEYGVYTFFVVIGWITLIFGCGFIWTQFCKAFYLSSSMCENGTNSCRRSRPVTWLHNTSAYRFYFHGKWCWEKPSRESTEPRDVISTVNDDNNNVPEEVAMAELHHSPPPPYDVALTMPIP